MSTPKPAASRQAPRGGQGNLGTARRFLESARKPVRAGAALWPFFGYAAFVVYGSLVPLDFHPMPLAQAWAAFQRIPFLELGIASRADWVANGVLYLPLALFATRAASHRGLAPLPAAALAVLVCAAIAVAVEFTQQFFPPRTVSQNDLLAEGLGSLAGALAACWLGGWFDRLLSAWAGGGSALLGRRLLELYAAAYLLLCFFPYDLLLSAQEVADKRESALWGWLLAANDRGLLFALLQLAVEAMLSAPIGVLLARATPGRPPGGLRAAALGALLGLLIEGGQFFIASGVSQGASVVSRSLGVALGALLAPWLQARGVAGGRAALRRAALLLYLLCLPALLLVNGYFSHPVQGFDDAAKAWQAVRLMPFYYHYYTTEAVALFSMGSVAIAYLPLAVLGWARGLPVARVALVTAAVAALVETGKLFLSGLHPDPSNVLIAVTVNALAAGPLAAQLMPGGGLAAGATPALPAAAPHGAGGLPDGRLARVLMVVLVVVVPLAAAQLLTFPVASGPLLALVAGAAALVWRWPVLALALLPAALPVLDLAPWSGRLYWDEFDTLSLVCLAVALHRSPPPPGHRAAALRPLTLAFALLGVSLAASTLRALWPLAWPDAASFAGYASPYNALRIVKGAVWAWLVVRLWQALAPRGAQREQALGLGMATGLALTVAVVLWERVVFTGLLNFSADYRVTGLFSAMHKGGAFIECWLAVAASFVLAALFGERRPWLRAAAVLLLAAATYAMMVTYSRNGYAALAVMGLATFAVTLAAAPRWRAAVRPLAWAAVALAVVAAVALPILGGGFAWQRLAQSGQDLAVRQAHWVDGLRLRDDGALTALVGMGLGRYPDSHFWRSTEPVHAASFRLLAQGEQHWLRLGQGATVYVEQIVARPAAGALRLSMKLRAAAYPATLTLTLCEKWTLSSLRCVSAAAQVDRAPVGAGWQALALPLDATPLLAGAALARAPLKLSLQTPVQGVVEVTDLQLSGPDGQRLLSNGDFAQGMDHWFFSTDVDPPWQLHSLPLTVLFEQGWLGVLAWGAVLAGALIGGSRLARAGAAQVPAALPALLAFAVCGSLNTLIDAPRFLGLLLLLLWLAADRRAAPVGHGRPASATLGKPPSSPV